MFGEDASKDFLFATKSMHGLSNSFGFGGTNATPNKAKERKIDVIMSNSFGFGGTNATLIFKKYS